jgi:ketosteroid isomerase-like protein
MSQTTRRPLLDSAEIHMPFLASCALGLLLRAPAPVRRRVMTDAFARAQHAFNRGDFEAVFVLFTDDAEYAPPPALHSGPPIIGRRAAFRFWQDVLRRYDESRIQNLSIEALGHDRFVRTARLTHRIGDERLDHTIRQTTALRRGRVVSQVNVEL